MNWEECKKMVREAASVEGKAILDAYKKECEDVKKRIFDYFKKGGIDTNTDYNIYCRDCWKDACQAFPNEIGPVNDPKAYAQWRNNAYEQLVKEFLAILHKEGKFGDFIEGIRFNEFDPEDKNVRFSFSEGYGLWATDQVEIYVE